MDGERAWFLGEAHDLKGMDMLNTLAKLGEKAICLLDRKKASQRVLSWMGTPSAPTYEYQSLAQLLPYESYDPTTKLFHNKKSMGFILEVTPLTGASEETVAILTSLLTDVLSPDIDLHILLWANDKIGPVFDRFEAAQSKGGETFAWLAKKRTDFLKKGVYESLTQSHPFIVRDFRLLFAVSKATKRFDESLTHALIQCRQDITSSLKSISLHSWDMPISSVMSLLSDWCAPVCDVDPIKQQWNPLDPISQQLTDPEMKLSVLPQGLIFSKQKPTCQVTSFTVRDFPQQVTQWQVSENLGQLFNSALQIPCPFVISFSLRLQSSDRTQMHTQYQTLNKEKSANSPLSKLSPQIAREATDWAHVRQRLSQGDKLVKVFYQVLLYAPVEDAGNCERKLRDLYRANGWRLRKESFLQLSSWLASFPMMLSEGMYEDLKHFKRLRTMTAFNAMNIAPLQGEWKGTATPALLLPGRRGQIALWSPFDNKEGNYNVAISASSGKGKSMFTQEYIKALLGAGGRVWVIDVGRSYEKICKRLKGTFIEFDPNSHLSLNPFSTITDFDDALMLLKPLLAGMARPSSLTSDEEMTFLEKGLKAAWNEQGTKASITTVAHWLAKQNHPICQNLSHLLYSYTVDGMYGRYFEGKATINLNDPFVVLELQELKAKKDLQKTILLALMYQISQTMYMSNRAQYKSCIIDEAWDLLGGDHEGAAKFIEMGFRTARRFNANFVTITQSINDYYKNNTSEAAFENSDYKVILGQSPETIDQIKKAERLNLDPFTERLFKSLRKTEDYSECIIKSPSGLSVHRILFDTYSRILYSSKGDEFEAVRQLTQQGASLHEAIERVAQQLERK